MARRSSSRGALHLHDGRTHTGKTDDQGLIRFKLPTREYRESQSLQLIAELPERNLRTAANFLLAVRGFSIDIATVRSIVTAGETFEATLTTKKRGWQTDGRSAEGAASWKQPSSTVVPASGKSKSAK